MYVEIISYLKKRENIYIDYIDSIFIVSSLIMLLATYISDFFSGGIISVYTLLVMFLLGSNISILSFYLWVESLDSIEDIVPLSIGVILILCSLFLPFLIYAPDSGVQLTNSNVNTLLFILLNGICHLSNAYRD